MRYNLTMSPKPNVVLFIAASLDGYIARADEGIDWLSIVEREGEDYGYAAFFAGIDAVIAGRKTYELGLTFGEWPYPNKKTFVFTHRPLVTDRTDVQAVSGDAAEVLQAIQGQGLQNVWLVGGGAIVNAFLKHKLIDEYILSTIPIILGSGIPLFPPPAPEQQVELLTAKTFPSGLVQTHYRTRR